MNLALLNHNVQQYLLKSASLKPSDLALMKSPFKDVSAAELAEQLDGRQRSAKKIPLWHETDGIYYPPKLAMEQCSSTRTATYKAGLIPLNGRGADLTGGFGVDSYYFSRTCREVTHCEINAQLSQLVQHNNQILAAKNIRCINTDGLAWLKETNETFDYVYMDPSRRINQQKVFTLNDAEPAIVPHQEWMLQKAPLLIVKAAPMLDIAASLNQLLHVAEIHVISVGNECKELLFVQRRGHEGEPRVHCILLESTVQKSFTFALSEEKNCENTFGQVQKYLYEPDAALLKAGCFKLPAHFYQFKKLHQHTHLYTANQLNLVFPGRVFIVNDVKDYGAFRKNKNPVKANIAARNFPMNTEQLRKKHKIIDGGDVYLFFVTDDRGDLKVIYSKKA
ncbi:Conserved hypothetical protein 95 [bacterium A37T11]|nr:Conserved hypothetical protein 95 [bacterium A37T11]